MSVAVLAFATPSAAEEPKVEASMVCDRAPEPGRVRCFVELKALGDRTISWADVVIQKVPDFVVPLKGRLGNEDATAKEPGRLRWAFGIIARKTGQGEAHAQVRLVLCAGEHCAPSSVDMKATISVGN